MQLGGDACGCSDGASRTLVPLDFGCSAQSFQQAVQAEDVRIQTSGAIGDQWVDLPVVQQLQAVELLYVRSSAQVRLRIGAAPATLTGSGGTFPTGFAGAETFNVTIDGVAVAVTFQAGDQTAAQVAARINAAAALAGLASPRVTVSTTTGQLAISGVLTGAQGSVAVTGGTGRTQIGFAGTPSDVGDGADVDVQGVYLNQFPRSPNAPLRIQASGIATMDIIAAGRATA